MSDDDQLMMRVQAGDMPAFEELVEKYQGPLLGFFYRNSHDRQFSEDLAQETLLRVYNQAWDYLPRQRFRGWMFRIARNLLIDNVRRQSHDALVRAVKGATDGEGDAMARLVAEVTSPEDRAHEREFAALIDELLDEIPEDQRLTFTLHHFGELPLADVADIMDTNVATSKSRLRLAREKLQQKLRDRGFHEPPAGNGD